MESVIDDVISRSTAPGPRVRLKTVPPAVLRPTSVALTSAGLPAASEVAFTAALKQMLPLASGLVGPELIVPPVIFTVISESRLPELF